VLLGLVVHSFAPTGVVVVGLHDILERRQGERIKAKGIYRDPVRSLRSHMVKASRLRWLCAMQFPPKERGKKELARTVSEVYGFLETLPRVLGE
jgi:hypothetical protein